MEFLFLEEQCDMNRNLLLLAVLVAVLVGASCGAFKIQTVKASGIMYIRANGSIDPLTANITNMGNITYIFTDDNYGEVVIERSNIVVDGGGYSLQGTGTGTGISLTGRSNVTIKNLEVKAFFFGIYFNSSSGSTVTGNNILANYYHGLCLSLNSNNNNVYGNMVTGNGLGIIFDCSSSNTVCGNTIADNVYGIYVNAYMCASSNNRIFHNNVLNNTVQVFLHDPIATVWDDGYPSGGNYWSNYTGVDSDHDGIGDSSHVIGGGDVDHYPLMGMFSNFTATSEHHVQTICNSSISNFQFSGTAISFSASGKSGTAGFCRICIPTALMNGSYAVSVGGAEVSYTLLPFSNSTHSYLYFSYTHSTKEVIIVPEFQLFIILPIFMTATLLTVMVYERKGGLCP